MRPNRGTPKPRYERNASLREISNSAKKRLVFRRSYSDSSFPPDIEKNDMILQHDLEKLGNELERDPYLSTLDRDMQDKICLYFSAVLRCVVMNTACCEMFVDEELQCVVFEIHTQQLVLCLGCQKHFAALAFMSEDVFVSSRPSEYGSIHITGLLAIKDVSDQ